MSYKNYIFIGLSILLSGCVNVNPVPKGYSGPLATVKDSMKVHSGKKVDFFYVEKYNGKYIENSRSKTLEVNYGNGFFMKPILVDRKIPAKYCTLHIKGRTTYAAPILALTNSVYEVDGDINFIPKTNHIYKVKGQLNKNRCSVWIEDLNSGRVVSKKIVKTKDCELGFFEK